MERDDFQCKHWAESMLSWNSRTRHLYQVTSILVACVKCMRTALLPHRKTLNLTCHTFTLFWALHYEGFIAPTCAATCVLISKVAFTFHSLAGRPKWIVKNSVMLMTIYATLVCAVNKCSWAVAGAHNVPPWTSGWHWMNMQSVMCRGRRCHTNAANSSVPLEFVCSSAYACRILCAWQWCLYSQAAAREVCWLGVYKRFLLCYIWEWLCSSCSFEGCPDVAT